MREAGLAAPSFIEGDWSPASGYLAGRALASDHEMTAVFAANDDMAIGAIFILCILLFRRGVVGELQTLLFRRSSQPKS